MNHRLTTCTSTAFWFQGLTPRRLRSLTRVPISGLIIGMVIGLTLKGGALKIYIFVLKHMFAITRSVSGSFAPATFFVLFLDRARLSETKRVRAICL